MDIGKIVAQCARASIALERSKIYCDYIAHICAVALARPDPQRIIKAAGPVKYDLHPTDGYLLSSKKTLEVEDLNGNRYRVTVEEIQQ